MFPVLPQIPADNTANHSGGLSWAGVRGGDTLSYFALGGSSGGPVDTLPLLLLSSVLCSYRPYTTLHGMVHLDLVSLPVVS